MCKALCQNKDDELRLVSAFAGTELLKSGSKCQRVVIVVPFREEGTGFECVSVSELEGLLST